ncbi:MAG: hypothetical protein NTV49_02275 [Kiritimatiellaeota bacterium]|nr:hypothetical protein [Kiritimatiellota bacterium]
MYIQTHRHFSEKSALPLEFLFSYMRICERVPTMPFAISYTIGCHVGGERILATDEHGLTLMKRAEKEAFRRFSQIDEVNAQSGKLKGAFNP